MRTTLLNPTIWLLAATCVAALAGALRREHARHALDRVVELATAGPVLALLLLLAAGGLGSRLVIGYLSPGAYVEEVLGARAFLTERTVYGGDDRAELKKWMSQTPAPADPWTLPGITPCQASAMVNRPQFYTSQGHPPMLLLASVPIVQMAGGRGLYVLLALASVVAVAIVVMVMIREAGLAGRSRTTLLLGAAIVGWQPIVAGVRQGDAVVLAGALVLLAWRMARNDGSMAGVAGGLAACVTLPALAVVPALVRCRGRSGALACVVLAGAVAATIAAAGPLVFADFSSTVMLSARTYAEATHNYALAGRALVNGLNGPSLAALVTLAALASLWRGRSADAAFGTWMTLGLLASPIVWSQHLVLALVPIVVLLRRIVRTGSAMPLAAWALLVLLLSLPDPAVAHLHDLVALSSPTLATVPVVSIGLVVLWAWLVLGTERPSLPDTVATRYDVAPVAVAP